MVVNVPRDLEDEILSRVPDKSLARFRSVCKQWNTQLVEETFLEQHSSRMHNYDGEHRILFKNARSKIFSLDITEDMGNSSLAINDISLINRRYSHHEMRKRIRVHKIVHCTGLLLCVMDNQLSIWNPLLKETRWVKCGSDFHRFDDAYGLGYVRQSPTHCNYKIVRFRCARNDRDRPPRVEVYEFKSNTWKVIADVTFDWHLRVPLSNVSLGRNPYWIGLKEDHSSKAFIQSFDFSKERFQSLDYLPFVYNEYNPLALETFRGYKLSLLEQCHQTRKISIWVRHLITPWTILMVVAIQHFPLLYQVRPLQQVIIRPWLYRSHFSTNYCVDRNGTLVMSLYEEGSRYVSIYRVRDKEFQTVLVGSAGNSCSYVPSLARPHGFSKQDTTRIRWRKTRFN